MRVSFLLKVLFLFYYLIFYFSGFSLKVLIGELMGLFILFLGFLLLFKKFFLNYFWSFVNFLFLVFSFAVLILLKDYFNFNESLKSLKQEKLYLTDGEYGFLNRLRFTHTFWATVLIQKVLYPGMYISEVSLENVYPYKKKYKDKDIEYNQFQNKILLAAVQFSKKDFWAGCKVKIQFYGKVFFNKLKEKNEFHQYLSKHNAKYFFRITDKNIKKWECPQTVRDSIKEKILEILSKSILTEKQKQMALGLIFGNSNWMDKIYKEEIKKLGLMHLFAASGLHLGILFFVFYFPLSKIFGKKNALSYVLPLPVLFFYLLLLEFPFTLVRAYIFYGIYSLQMILNRKCWVGDLLLNTLIVMIFLFPLDVLNLSTIFSFLSVGGILVFYSSLKDLVMVRNLFPSYNKRERFKIYVYQFLVLQFLITFCASIFLQPLLLYIFKGYSLLSPLYNMIFVPYVSILLPFLFLAVGINYLSLEISFLNLLSLWIWKILKFFYDILIYMLEFFYYKSVIWLQFSSTLNLGFILSLGYLSFFIGYYFFIQKRGNPYNFKNIFFMSYGIYQFFYFVIYLI